MPKYQCESCQMSIEPLVCGKCGTELAHNTIKVEDKNIAVSECPKGCGKIKSPGCCGKDMKPQT